MTRPGSNGRGAWLEDIDAPAVAGDECTIVSWCGYVQCGFFAVRDGRARSVGGSRLDHRCSGGWAVKDTVGEP